MWCVVFCFQQCNVWSSVCSNVMCGLLFAAMWCVVFCFQQCDVWSSVSSNVMCGLLFPAMWRVVFCFQQCDVWSSVSSSVTCGLLFPAMWCVVFCFQQCDVWCSVSSNVRCGVLFPAMWCVVFCTVCIRTRSLCSGRTAWRMQHLPPSWRLAVRRTCAALQCWMSGSTCRTLDWCRMVRDVTITRYVISCPTVAYI